MLKCVTEFRIEYMNRISYTACSVSRFLFYEQSSYEEHEQVPALYLLFDPTVSSLTSTRHHTVHGQETAQGQVPDAHLQCGVLLQSAPLSSRLPTHAGRNTGTGAYCTPASFRSTVATLTMATFTHTRTALTLAVSTLTVRAIHTFGQLSIWGC